MHNHNLSCHEMDSGEVLNAEHSEYPLFKGVLYGNKVDTAKFSKRLSCSIKHLPIRVEFLYEYNIERALDVGVTKDPTFILNGVIFLEGLQQSEVITEAFIQLLNNSN